ncbi:MAG: hypothetical protein R2712_27095 [Vicinamibacterales bacterium]
MGIAIAASAQSPVPGGLTAERSSGLSHPAAPAAVQRFVRAALSDRIAANDFPDHSLLRSEDPIIIRSEMPAARAALTQAALPTGRRFALMSVEDLQVYADRVRRPVYFIAVDTPEIDGDRGQVWLGVEVVAPRPGWVSLCCCRGGARFERSGADTWQFVDWYLLECH